MGTINGPLDTVIYHQKHGSMFQNMDNKRYCIIKKSASFLWKSYLFKNIPQSKTNHLHSAMRKAPPTTLGKIAYNQKTSLL